MAILITGFSLSLVTGFYQIKKLPEALRYLCKSIQKKKEDQSYVSGYQALCTALAATVGTGNLAGVAGAIAIGGPGAVFWMWISGILGMMVKFTEVVLAHHFRQKDTNGSWIGGPMYMIKNGMPKCMHFLGLVYCFFGTVAVFGIGNTSQVNTIIGAIDTSFITMIGVRKLISHLLIGVILALLIFRVFYQGPGNIGNLTAKLVPFAAGSYILLSVTALLINFDRLPNAFLAIIHGAFEPSAVTGGIIGSVLLTMRTGISRGVFTNEAGMGTASIAHSESSEADPVRQGLLGITEVFFDTIVICTLTALVILSSDIAVPYGYDTGITLTTNAFTSIFGDWCGIVISVITVLLAFATILGWGLYGMRCAQYIFGESVWRVFPALQAAATFLGACINTSTAWVYSELVNAFMVLTNLIAVTYLLPEFLREIKAHRL